MCNVIVIGSSNTDMVFRTNKFPEPGETVMGGEFDIIPGGKGANQAVAAARAGATVHFITKVGNDDLGKNALKGYELDGINTEHIFTDCSMPSGVAMILVDDSTGANSIVVAPGANSTLHKNEIYSIESVIKNANVLLLQLEIPLDTVETALKLANKYNVTTILDPAPAQKLGDELLQYVDIITPNQSETKILTGIDPCNELEIGKAVKILLAKVNSAVIITLGESGISMKSDKEEFLLEAQHVKAIDTTAAGDVFNGYLAAQLAMGLKLKEAISKANYAASISVTRKGAQPSIPYLKELDQTK